MTAPVPATDPRIDARAREIAKTKPGWPAWEHLAQGARGTCVIEARYSLARQDELEELWNA